MIKPQTPSRQQTHIMVDIETAGKKPGCPVLQIGAVPLSAVTTSSSASTLYNSVALPSFFQGISLRSNEAAGLLASRETLDWWGKQDSHLFDEVFSSTNLLKDTLEAFALYLLHMPGELIVWCCGTDFDFPILERAFETVAVDVPWKYYAKRDYRSFREQFPLSEYAVASLPGNSLKHNALADAEFQARMLVAIDHNLQEASNGRISVF